MAVVQTPTERAIQITFQIGYDPISGEVETKKRTYNNINLATTPEIMLDFVKKIVSLQKNQMLKTNVRDLSLLAEEM